MTKCPQCGAAAIPSQRFCGECGTRLQQSATPQSPDERNAVPHRPGGGKPDPWDVGTTGHTGEFEDDFFSRYRPKSAVAGDEDVTTPEPAQPRRSRRRFEPDLNTLNTQSPSAQRAPSAQRSDAQRSDAQRSDATPSVSPFFSQRADDAEGTVGPQGSGHADKQTSTPTGSPFAGPPWHDPSQPGAQAQSGAQAQPERVPAHQEQQAARQEAARQEAARQEAARQEAARQQAARQEQGIRQEREHQARQDQARQDQARQDQFDRERRAAEERARQVQAVKHQQAQGQQAQGQQAQGQPPATQQFPLLPPVDADSKSQPDDATFTQLIKGLDNDPADAPIVAGGFDRTGIVALPPREQDAVADSPSSEAERQTQHRAAEFYGASNHAEPASAEPAGAEPAGAEPAGAESARAESARAESARAESARAESVGAESARAESARAESAGAESAGAESAGAESAGSPQTQSSMPSLPPLGPGGAATRAATGAVTSTETGSSAGSGSRIHAGGQPGRRSDDESAATRFGSVVGSADDAEPRQSPFSSPFAAQARAEQAAGPGQPAGAGQGQQSQIRAAAPSAGGDEPTDDGFWPFGDELDDRKPRQELRETDSQQNRYRDRSGGQSEDRFNAGAGLAAAGTPVGDPAPGYDFGLGGGAGSGAGGGSGKGGGRGGSGDESEQKRKGLRTILIAAVAAVIVIVGAFAISGLFRGGDEEAPVADDTQQEQGTEHEDQTGQQPADPDGTDADSGEETSTQDSETETPASFEPVTFQSGSGNLRCQITPEGGAACQILQQNFSTPDEACTTGSNSGVAVGVNDEGVTWPCLTGNLGGGEVVEYDEPITAGDYTCSINFSTGVTCENGSGASFTLEFNTGVDTSGATAADPKIELEPIS